MRTIYGKKKEMANQINYANMKYITDLYRYYKQTYSPTYVSAGVFYHAI